MLLSKYVILLIPVTPCNIVAKCTVFHVKRETIFSELHGALRNISREIIDLKIKRLLSLVREWILTFLIQVFKKIFSR